MFEFIKRAAAGVKRVATSCLGYLKAFGLSYAALTQLAAGAGQTIFVLRRFVKYWTGSEDYAYSVPVTVISSSATVLTLLTSRTENIFHQFSENKADEPEIEIRTTKGKVFVVGASTLAFANGMFSALGNYLFAITLLETITDAILQRPSTDESRDEFSAMTMVQIAALSFYLSKLIANIAFTQRRARNNAKKIAHHFEQSDNIFDFDKRAFAIAITGTLIGGIPLPYFAYFSTSNSLMRIHYISISDDINHLLSGISAPLSLGVYILTGPVTLYNLLKKNKSNTPTPCWEIPVAGVTYTAMAIDCGNTIISNFTAFTSTSERALGLDPNNIYVRVIGGITSTNAAVINTFLNREGYRDSLARIVKRFGGHHGYEIIPQTPEDHLPDSAPASPVIEFLDENNQHDEQTPFISTAPVAIPKQSQTTHTVINIHTMLAPSSNSRQIDVAVDVAIDGGTKQDVVINVDVSQISKRLNSA